MKNHYHIRGLFVLGSAMMLTACQHFNQNYSKNIPVQKSPNAAGVVTSAQKQLRAEQTDLSNVFAFGTSEADDALRKQILMDLSKPGQNFYRDVADRKKRKASGMKVPGEKAGIEEIANYRREITMPIGTDKMLYEDGFLVKEHNKALQSRIFQEAKKAGFKTSKAGTYSLNNVVWKERGPNNIPGRMRNLVISPTNPNKWYAGSAGGGVWITENGGTNWRTTTDMQVPNLANTTVAISPANPSIVYSGTGEPFGNLDNITGSGLVKSTDGGETWSRMIGTEGFGSVGRLVVNPADANHLLVATSRGIYKTKDGGATWIKTYSGSSSLQNVQDLKASSDFSTQYASVNTYGVVKSTNGGDSWSLVFNAGSKAKNIRRIELAIAPSDNNRLFLSCETAPPSGGVATPVFYISDDAGDTYNELIYSSGDSKEILGAQGWYDNTVTFSPLDKNIAYVGGIYLAKITIDPANYNYTVLSIASGYTSGKLNTYVHPDQHGIVAQVDPTNPSRYRLLLTNDGGVYQTAYTTDPGTIANAWTGPVKGLNTTQPYGADKKKGEDAYLMGAQDNGSAATKTAPASATSQYLSMWGGDGFEVIWNYKDPNKLIFGSQFNNFGASNTGVQNTAVYGRAIPDTGSAKSPFISKLSNANNNADVIFTVSSNGVWRSTDFGVNWALSLFTKEKNGTWLGSGSYATVKTSVANPDVVWAVAAVSSPTNTSDYKVNLSKDNGQTFNKTTGSMPKNTTSYATALAASPVEAARAYVAFSVPGEAKVVKTNDYGATWTDVTGFNNGVSSSGFPDVPVHSILEMPFDPNVLWAGTDIGIVETTNGGASWYLNDKLPPVSVWNMKIVDDQVVLATHGRGVWTATIPELANYTMPEYVSPPEIVSVAQSGVHDMSAKAVIKYSNPRINAVKVFVDNNYVSTLSSTVANTNYNFTSSTLSEGFHNISVSGIYDNGAAETIKADKKVEIIRFNSGSPTINLPTITSNDVYVGAGKFVVDNSGNKFTYDVLNNEGHPYTNNTLYQTYFRTPIIVGTESKLTMSHMALTEAGYDYAYVEASTDMLNWTPVAIYDESAFSNWNGVPAANVDESLFQKSAIDFTGKFSAGTEVAVRLRLLTDPYDTRYGWAIKSIVPTSSLGVSDAVISGDNIVLAPNPVNDFADIYLPNKVKGLVKIGIYDISGKQIRVLEKPAAFKISFDVKDLAKGVYLIVLKSETASKTIKMLKD